MLRNRAANSPPESCGRQLLISASHCRDWDMLCVARGRIVIVIGPSKCRGELMRAICICHDERISSAGEQSNVLVPAAHPKMPLRDYEFRQARQRRAYEFSPSASGEILKSIRTCLDAGPALHVGTTCATRTAQHGVASAAQHVRGCKRGPTICAHACMRRSLVADSPPEKLMQ